ncbi:hypothetical protein FDECE_8084 [Fusarium decemcellulare]|nr:hypothetical protein FDECE_8084 [Fusarium decemcellulare]
MVIHQGTDALTTDPVAGFIGGLVRDISGYLWEATVSVGYTFGFFLGFQCSWLARPLSPQLHHGFAMQGGSRGRRLEGLSQISQENSVFSPISHPGGCLALIFQGSEGRYMWRNMPHNIDNEIGVTVTLLRWSTAKMANPD